MEGQTWKYFLPSSVNKHALRKVFLRFSDISWPGVIFKQAVYLFIQFH